MKYFFYYIFLLITLVTRAQEIEWYDVGKMHIQGSPSAEVSNPFQRFPDSLKNKVRERVWELSQNSTGLQLNFSTNSSVIMLRYQTEGDLGFPHMPPTGVSGVDLYLKDSLQNWQWAKGQFNFGDTITYNFKLTDEQVKGYNAQYLLYLPLYANVKWMKIGVHKNSKFIESPFNEASPIVVYGTSISQGACAGRPGTAWTSRLSRQINKPVLNFGFSGNGRLEKEIIEYISRIDSQVIILDCLANFTPGQSLTAIDAQQRLVQSVLDIRQIKPYIPIILTAHAGYPHGELTPSLKKLYTTLNKVNEQVYEQLLEAGVKNLHIITFEELGLTMDDFVDGVHPNDAGMLKYSTAYHKKLTEILDFED